MADNLRWFKVWTTIASDPHFQEMSLEDMGRWIVLGALTAAHGVNGKLPVTPHATVLCRHMNCAKEELKDVLKRLPNIQFEEGKTDYAIGTVTWKNWHKYQRDSTVAKRVQRLRSKRRGEERREEERRKELKAGMQPDAFAQAQQSARNGFSAWPDEWKELAHFICHDPMFDRVWWDLHDLRFWKEQNERFADTDLYILTVLKESVSYWRNKQNYKPVTARGAKGKIINSVSFNLERWEDRQRGKRT